MFRSSGCVAEMLVHGMRTGQQLLEPVHADGEGDGQADRRPERVAAADPVPEAEHVGGVDAEGGDRLGVGRDRDEVLGHRLRTAQPLDQPGPRRARVGHRLLGGEGLGGDDEQCARRVEPGQRIDKVRAVDVRHEVRPEIGALVGPERLADHHRPEVRAADPDIDDVGDPLARGPLPLPAAHALGELAHPPQHGVDVRHHVRTVDHDRPVGAVAQGHVQDRTVLGDVDLLAGEHPVPPALDIGLAAQRQQQIQCLGRDPVLRVVEEEPVLGQREALEPFGIVLEQLPQVDAAHALRVAGEILPGGRGGECRHLSPSAPGSHGPGQ